MILAVSTYLWAAFSVMIQAVSLYEKRLHHRLLVPVLNAAGALLLLILLIRRSLEIRFVALTGTFESLMFYSLCILLITSVYGVQKKIRIYPVLQFFVTLAALALLLVASSPLVSKTARPPVPALQSGWLILHVAFSFIGEAFFVFSFITALLVLTAKDAERQKQFDKLTYTSVVVGYPVFTLGALIFGAIWAEAAWGSFWSWDPKETWALITWLVYSLYLHLRLYRRSSLRLCSWIAVLGFLSTLFTFFGVNYLLSGLHSYG